MMLIDLAAPAKVKRTNFQHVLLRLGSHETAAIEQYIHDRVDRQSLKRTKVLQYEIEVRETTEHHRCGLYSARITAYLRYKYVHVGKNNEDIFLSVRDAFDVLGDRLLSIHDSRESRAFMALPAGCPLAGSSQLGETTTYRSA